MAYYNQLIKFLEEAKTDKLKTKHYDLENLKKEVKVSFNSKSANLV